VPHRPDAVDEILLAGAGSFAEEVADWAAAAGLRVAGLIDLHDGDRVGQTIAGIPVLSTREPGAGRGIAVAAGGDRAEHWRRLADGGWVPRTVLHPAAMVAVSVRLEPGAIVGPGAVIGAQSSVGEHALVSRGSLVGHHVSIGRFAAVLPGANVASSVSLGAGATIGMAGVVVDHVAVGAAATVAAGAVVLDDVEAGVRVQGVPARPFAR
jgi:sugar O-acyltransferase (sialic acid O-acetyltransferase NeuD family)